MKETLRQEYIQKMTSPREAVKLIKSGDTVFLGACTSMAYALCEALGERENELENVTLVCAQTSRPMQLASGSNPKAFRFITYFMGAQERALYSKGIVDYTSVHLSQLPILFHETAKPDVAFLEVSPPDENGYMSLGANGVAMGSYLLQTAKKVILQVNRCAPYVYGDYNLVHISQAEAIVEHDQDLVENSNLPLDEKVQAISSYLLDQIPDGACIQLGLGGVASAVGFGLKQKNDLGAHTELMTDSMMALMKLGVLNNSRKQFLPNKTVAGFAYGSKVLYEFIDHNPNMYFLPLHIVNDPYNIGLNDNVISVNTALSVDLFGQVCADNIAGRQYSATGGQLDFVRGAQRSKNGKSFIAITSTYSEKEKGPRSRIVSQFPVGTAVTTPRSDVQYIVTEYGCVNLKPLTMKQRALAMIRLAHPDFRAELQEEAKKAGII